MTFHNYTALSVATNLSELAIFLESSSQEISGDGLPVAIHLRNTDGPGCIVSSVKACLICGGSTVNENKITQNLFFKFKIIYSQSFYRE